MTQHSKPVVTVLTAPGENEPPGMDALRARAEVRFASDEPTLRDTLPGTDVMMVTDFRTEALAAACEEASVPCTLRLQPGYDHSYFFIASFIDEHLRYHAEKLQ